VLAALALNCPADNECYYFDLVTRKTVLTLKKGVPGVHEAFQDLDADPGVCSDATPYVTRFKSKLHDEKARARRGTPSARVAHRRPTPGAHLQGEEEPLLPRDEEDRQQLRGEAAHVVALTIPITPLSCRKMPTSDVWDASLPGAPAVPRVPRSAVG